MPDKGSTKYKHLTENERLEIQQCLDHGMTFKAIGKRVGKDQTTISKEVKKHLETMVYASKEVCTVARVNRAAVRFYALLCFCCLRKA